MNGPLAQLVALTCHGNSFLSGTDIPTFFPSNSTCQFCDYIHFVEFKKSLFGNTKQTISADNPNRWLGTINRNAASGIRLKRISSNDPRLSDRMSAGFIGGGGQWILEVTYKNALSEFWISRWEVWNQNAQERRIWRVDYAVAGTAPDSGPTQRSTDCVWQEFKDSLTEIHNFSKEYTEGGFTNCFEQALLAIDSPDTDVGYHKDLFLDGQLTPKAKSLIKASMASWVYGGMGSWNDMGFDGEAQKEYERVSEKHFTLINEVIAVVASSTHKEQIVSK